MIKDTYRERKTDKLAQVIAITMSGLVQVEMHTTNPHIEPEKRWYRKDIFERMYEHTHDTKTPLLVGKKFVREYSEAFENLHPVIVQTQNLREVNVALVDLPAGMKGNSWWMNIELLQQDYVPLQEDTEAFEMDGVIAHHKGAGNYEQYR